MKSLFNIKNVIFTLTLSLCIPFQLNAADVTIESPGGGFTTKRIQSIKGNISGYSGSRAILVLNGIPQTIPLSGGEFRLNAVIAPGNNVIEVKAGGASDKVTFYAKVPKRDVKVVMTWDTPTDVDLWVIDPKGEKCYYGNRSTKLGGNLDVDVTSGFGPETYTMASSMPGSYSVQVQYYSSNSAPITRVNVYLVVYEGTPREQRKHFQFVMTKANQVYHITDFQIQGE
ncbi:MAG: DUF2135 domain-containing protein [bacterium]|nr:DUF2135 domain-containing protein [bacterium]